MSDKHMTPKLVGFGEQTAARRPPRGAVVNFTNVGRVHREAITTKSEPVDSVRAALQPEACVCRRPAVPMPKLPPSSPPASSKCGASSSSATTRPIDPATPSAARPARLAVCSDDVAAAESFGEGDVLEAAEALLCKMRNSRNGLQPPAVQHIPTTELFLQSIRSPAAEAPTPGTPLSQMLKKPSRVRLRSPSEPHHVASIVSSSTSTQTNPQPLLRHAWSQCRYVVDSPPPPPPPTTTTSATTTQQRDGGIATQGALSSETEVMQSLCELDVYLQMLCSTPLVAP